MSGSRLSPLQSWIIGIALVGGALLAIIGIRYLVVPKSAAFTFGVADEVLGYELHYIIGLRNVWLGLLAIVFAILREWRALTLWFGFGTVVCFADAGHCRDLERQAAAGRVPYRCGGHLLGADVSHPACHPERELSRWPPSTWASCWQSLPSAGG